MASERHMTTSATDGAGNRAAPMSAMRRDEIRLHVERGCSCATGISGELLREVDALLAEMQERDAELAACRAALEAQREAMLDAVDCLRRASGDGEPNTLSQRDEARLASDSLERALAPARPATDGGEG